ncbi:MAG: hypothetical protein ACE5HQ_05070 [Gemmatimonadota bacterium]
MSSGSLERPGRPRTADSSARKRDGERRTSRRTGALAAAGVIFAATLATASPALGQDWREFRWARQPGSVETLDVEVAYGAGHLSVRPATGNLLYDMHLRYDASRFEPSRRWEASSDRAKLRISLKAERSDTGAQLELDDMDLRLEDLKGLGDSHGRLDLALNRSVPTALHIAVGAAESSLNLGGIPLTRLRLETGASETRLAFEQPNPAEMTEMLLTLGAASFRSEKLGNANFETFRFKGGVGDVVLDFTGDWRRSAHGSISMGIGSIRLRFPRDLAVRIEKDSFFTSFDPGGLMKVDGGYESPDWDSAETRLDLDLGAAFGTIKVELVP